VLAGSSVSGVIASSLWSAGSGPCAAPARPVLGQITAARDICSCECCPARQLEERLHGVGGMVDGFVHPAANCWTKWRTSSGRSSALAQRRHLHGKTLTDKRSPGTSAPPPWRSDPVRAAISRDPSAGWRAAQALKLLVLQTRRSFGCTSNGAPRSHEKDRALVGQLEAAEALRHGPVNAPFLVPEELASSSPVEWPRNSASRRPPTRC